MSRPGRKEYAQFFQPYMEIVTDADSGLNELLESSLEACNSLFSDLDPGKEDYRYAEGKWSIKELLQHIIDTERIFAYRALRFARNDSTGLPGFDENLYVETCDAGGRSLSSLLEEFKLIRKSNILMFESMNENVLKRMGKIDGNAISVRALGFIICGHLLHHLKVIEERYL
ncbi:MAG: DinB family protein [Lutimonas sp.]